jgi:hypothetical protein
MNVVTNDFVCDFNYFDMKKGDHVRSIRHDICSNSSFSESIVSLIRTFFYNRVHKFKFDQEEQNAQYLTGQT